MTMRMLMIYSQDFLLTLSLFLQYASSSYDKKSDKGSKSVPMRHENSGASKVVENWLPTSVSDTSDAQLSDYV
jgi:hypothetical protein